MASARRGPVRRTHTRCAALLALALLCCPAGAYAQTSTGPWELSAGGFLGPPSGWVQVRENQLQGTRLDFRRDLAIADMSAIELGGAYHFALHTALRITVESYRLAGIAILPRDVLFNGTTLEQGTPLATRTDFPSFVRVTVIGDWTVPAVGGGRFHATAGLTAALLTFRLRGTIAASSVGHETKEDFVTQELPVPLVGLTFEHPIAGRFDAHAGLDGGYLPRVNSLRREGGIVTLSQSHLDFDVGIGYVFSRTWHAEAGYHAMHFYQNEQSHEDGNVIQLGVNAFRIAVTSRF